MKIDNDLKWIDISGNPKKIGIKLGELGKEAVHNLLIKSDLWKMVTSYNDLEIITKLHKNTKTKFPQIYEEIKGLAQGLKLPFEDVFLWNCRGEILANTNDGCTTVQIPSKTNCIAHNEDGFPFFLKKCFIANICVNNQLSFISFCYPGSIPGHTFAVNKKGLVMTVNNLRLEGINPEIPRMVITRALLNCDSLDDSISLIKNNLKTSGFNLSLISKNDSRLLDIEFGNGNMGIQEIQKVSLHSNHAIYSPLNKEKQIITKSSSDRQKRFSIINNENNEIIPFHILRDTKGDGLPIFRTEIDDPDNENTIATAIFKVEKKTISYLFYESNKEIPSYKGMI